MEFMDVLLKRRSTRKFSDEKITKDELDKILKAGLLAPSSMNRKPVNFLVVERKETLSQLAKSKDHGAELIAGADKAIVVIADTDLGIGSCWVQIHLREKDGVDAEEIVRNIVKIDSHYRIVGIMALGHSDDIPEPHTIDDIDKEKIHFLV